MKMEMLSRAYFDAYKNALPDIEGGLRKLEAPKNGGFEFLLEAGAVYSSQIEGNTMDLNSFMNAKSSAGPKPKEFQEIVDLKAAYDFAREHSLTEENLLAAHALLSRLFVSDGNQGVYRQDKVGVFSASGLVYMAVEHEKVPQEMRQLFAAIAGACAQHPSAIESFYYASLAHLHFAHIHPFVDGNGRAARLLEKWLLATLIGERAWLVESEKYYWEHRSEYYKKINLGVNYYELDYSRCIPFLHMLPAALVS
jgi:Fic family protein